MGGATRFLLVVASPLSLILHRRSSSLYRRFSLRPSFSSSSYFTLSHHRNFTISLQHLPITNSSLQPLHTQSNSIGVDYYNYSNNQHHPWPEWCNFVSTLLPGPDTQGIISSDDSFVSYDNLSQEFVNAAITCLAFARSQPRLLGLLPRKDIEVVVQNGNPFLFQSGNDAQRRMRAFLGTAGTTVLESEIAQTVDLMKYLLSYASNPSVSLEKTDYSIEFVESSVRNLLSELAKAINRNTVSDQHQVPSYYQQQPIPLGQNIEMKKGDWICSRCSFMNFARNVKCLECEEARPKRQLTGGEWECPQCDFFNYRRNTMCLRCDCKRPGEASIATAGSSSSLGYNNGDYENKRYSESKLAANEEKAERWFTKVSQSNNSADLSSAAADEDFPEIMPLRKGENRFVVSTRKTPLERRMANSQYQRNLGNEVLPEGNVPQNAVSNNNLDSSFGRRLDQIITRTQTFSEADDRNISGQNTGTVGPNTTRSGSLQDGPSKGINSGYVPFVPLPADMFAKKTESSSSEQVGAESAKSALLEGGNSQRGTIPRRDASGNPGEHYQLSENPEDTVENWNKEDEQTKKSDGWFNRVAELHNAPNSTNAISDEDFPDIMPMRKGENKFVVSKKKDRSLTSPMYKRQMAMDQANNNTFVPFVPFPPDYFAKKSKTQPDSVTPAVDATEQAAGMSPAKSDDAKQGYLNLDREASRQDQQTDNVINSGAQSSGYQSQSFPGSNAVKTERWSADAYSGQHETSNTSNSNITRTMFSSHGTGSANASSRYAEKDNVFRSGEASTTGSSSQNLSSSQSSSNRAGSTTPSPKAQNYQSGWTGKSLEGSAVKETDPLDMSEEAKAERWFRRVAQIKDSSELSQIPDEDFPSIMPMRKGVNRFVVSKRKTPLERRLTSPQYRRNLPVVSSDPVKKDDDTN